MGKRLAETQLTKEDIRSDSDEEAQKNKLESEEEDTPEQIAQRK